MKLQICKKSENPLKEMFQIGLKLWALEGYRQTDKQTNKQTELF